MSLCLFSASTDGNVDDGPADPARPPCRARLGTGAELGKIGHQLRMGGWEIRG